MSNALPPAIATWAAALCDALATEQLHQHCSVFVALPGLDGLVLAGQHWGAGQDLGLVRIGEWTVPLHGSIVGRVYRTGRPALIGDIATDPDYRTYPGAAARSELAVPIVVGGSTVGVVNVEGPRPGTYGIADLDRIVAHVERAAVTFPGIGPSADSEPTA